MEFLLACPVTLKILGSLVLILILYRAAKSLVLAMAAGAAGLAFWSGHAPASAAGIAWEQVRSADTLLLTVMLILVIWLSELMAVSGVMQELVGAVRRRFSRHASMAILPALIGFLPMPGGAYVSAPLVGSCDSEGAVHDDLKVLANYWFRHIWECWWPLYPGVLVAIKLSQLEVWQFVLLQCPLTLLCVAAGILFILRPIWRLENPAEEAPPAARVPSLRRIPVLLAPVGTVILLYAAIRIAWPGLTEISQYMPMSISAVAALGLLQGQRRIAKEVWRSVLTSPKAYLMALIVALARIYGAYIEAELPGGARMAETMQQEMSAAGIPLVAVYAFIPLVCGLTTGVAVAFAGASFPIVMGLLPADASWAEHLATVSLAFSVGFVGMMLSPVHICLLMTTEYFRARLPRILLALLRPALFLLAGIALYAALLYRLGPWIG